MSVIGTTLKQPRVFAHDAVALSDLPGCVWRGVKGLKLLDGGSGFVAGDYTTWLSTPITTSNAGNGLGIEVITVDGDGTITDEEIQIPACTTGNAYNIGDIVTVNPPSIYHNIGIDSAGTGYTSPTGPFKAVNADGTWSGMTVNVTGDDGAGGVTAIEIVEPGNGYSNGDVLTIEDAGEDATFTINISTAAIFEVTDLLWTAWDYGCPFTSAYMGSQGVIIEDVTDANVGKPLYGDNSYDASATNLGEENVNGELGQIDQLAGFLKKTMYTYTCGCEEGTCSCTYETPGPGAALYIGAAMTSITLVMESGSVTTFNNVPAGAFMPVSALTVCAATPEAEEGVDPKAVILALF